MLTVPAHIRANGEIRARFSASNGRTSVAGLFETGGLRLKFPKAAEACEGVLVNTAGGIAGGDKASLEFHVEAGGKVMLTTQSAEKIYRAQTDCAEIEVHVRVDEGASLAWLPQETILFSGARLRRRLDADLESNSTLTILEPVVFGRLAMGEQVVEGEFRDRWRVRRNRALLFAEDFRIDGAIAGLLDRPVIGGGARSAATLLHIAPDCENRLAAFRAAMADTPCEWGASAWNGMLVARLVSASPEQLRAAIVTALGELLGRSAPRVWQ